MGLAHDAPIRRLPCQVGLGRKVLGRSERGDEGFHRREMPTPSRLSLMKRIKRRCSSSSKNRNHSRSTGVSRSEMWSTTHEALSTTSSTSLCCSPTASRTTLTSSRSSTNHTTGSGGSRSPQRVVVASSISSTPSHVATIQGLQPYVPVTGLPRLSVLRDFSNIDKHRLIHAARTVFSATPAITSRLTIPSTVTNVQTFAPGTPIEDGAEIARFQSHTDLVMQPAEDTASKPAIWLPGVESTPEWRYPKNAQMDVNMELVLASVFGAPGVTYTRAREFRNAIADTRGIIDRFNPEFDTTQPMTAHAASPPRAEPKSASSPPSEAPPSRPCASEDLASFRPGRFESAPLAEGSALRPFVSCQPPPQGTAPLGAIPLQRLATSQKFRHG